MADISKIKTPDGTTYDIKDTTARANGGVTGVKGNSESSYRKGNVNITPANIGAVAKSDELQTTNPFTTPSLKGPYISKIDNAFYAADKRWTVTATNGSGVANLFDGSYETVFVVADGVTSVVTMDFSSSTYFPGYPYGYILVSVYYTARPASISCRAYCNYEPHGLGWFDIPLTMLSDSASAATVYRGRQGRYNISKIEFTITGQKTGSYNTTISQIEMHLDRPDSSRNPFVSKYAAETLYYNLTAPKFIGALQGNADTAGELTLGTQVTGSTVNDFKGSTFKVASIKSMTISGLASSDGMIIWIPYSSSYGRQIVLDDTTHKIFSRYYNNGTWSDWEAVAMLDKADANALMNALDTGSSTPTDADYYISQYVGGGTSTTTYHRRPVSALWEYIKGKISSILGLTASNYGGTSAKATADASGNTITTYYAPKSTTVTNVALATNKITKTINGTTTDVVTAATTSAYGITKLSTATNSTAVDVAATPSAVKTAKDRADEAYSKAATVESGLNGNIIYDHTFTISNGVATFTPHVYQKGQEVTTNYAASCFTWKYRLIDGSEVNLTTKSNRGCDVTISNMGYGGHVIGIFTPS